MSCFSLSYTLNKVCRGVITDAESASPRGILDELRPTRSSSAGWLLLTSVVSVLLSRASDARTYLRVLQGRTAPITS